MVEEGTKKSIRRILLNPLQEAQKSFVDLIYVIKTSLSLNLISEKQALPIFYELYELKKSLGKSRFNYVI